MSPSENPDCPERDQLVQFMLGHLTEPELEAVERHLSDCAACGDTLQNLNAVDTLVEVARSARADLPETEMVESLIARVRELSSESSSGSEGAIDERAEGIRCLFGPPEGPDELGRVGDYRVLGHLGTGGMGVVFEAQDEQLKRTVALKILPPSLGTAARGRFLQEARAAAAIDHENVVTIYQVGEDRGLAFLAMQRLEGETLESLVKREGALPKEQIVQIGKQLAMGLRAAHAEGLIHRDVKPANIWVETGRERVKLLDFGVARTLHEEPQLTESGMVVGTPAYMSPEQAVGERVDERSDLFSLGCVLYRLATGKLPFEGANALAMLRAIQTTDPRPPEELNPEVSGPLADLVMSLLEKEADCRPQSAEVVLEAFEEIGRGERQLSGLPSRGALRKRRARTRGRRALAGAAWRWGGGAVALVLLGVLGYFSGPAVIRVVMNKGELVIESTDPNVKIEILQGGQVARIVDLEKEQSIDLTAGEYGVQVADEEGDWTLSAEKLTLTRGEKETIKVWREARGVASRKDISAHSESLTYDGKGLEHWISELESERNPQRLAEAVHAVTVLGNEESAGKAAEAIFRSLRVYGSISIDNSPRGKLIEASRQALWEMPGDAVLPAMLEEIANGSDNSRAFLNWMIVMPTDNMGYDMERVSSFSEAMKSHAGEITSALLALSRDESKKPREWALAFLAGFCRVNEIDPKEIDGLIPRFQEELSSQDASTIMAVSSTLIKSAPDSEGLVDALVCVLLDKGALKRSSAITYLGQLGSRAAPAVPELAKLLDDYVKQANAERSPHLDDPFGGRMGLDLRADIIQLLGSIGSPAAPAVPKLMELLEVYLTAPNHDDPYAVYMAYDPFGPKKRLDLRLEIIETLGKIGPGAKAALPLLEEVVSTEPAREPSPVLSPRAKQAIAAIAAVEPAPSGQKEEEIKERPDLDETASKEGVSAASVALTYQGEGLEYWLSQLESERDQQLLAEAVRAASALADDESAGRSARAIFALMRLHGSLSLDGSPRAKLVETSRQAMWGLPSDGVITAILDEIENGNERSWDFMRLMLTRPRAGAGYDPRKVAEFLGGMKRNDDKIASALLDLLRTDSPRTRQRALTVLRDFCALNHLDLGGIDGLIPRFQEELSNDDVSVVLTVSGTLIKSKPDSPGLVAALLRVLSGEDSKLLGDSKPLHDRAAYYCHLVIQRLGELGPRAAPAVPRLVELLEEWLKQSPPGEEERHYWAYGSVGQVDLRCEIVRTLGKIGPGAKASLPLLESIDSTVVVGKHSPDIRSLAEQAIAAITDVEPAPGGQEAEEIKERPDLDETASKEGVSSASGALTYNGEGLDYWLGQFESERNPERLTDAVCAVSALGNRESAGEAARAIFAVMRVHGLLNHGTDLRGKLIDASRQALWEMPADAVVSAMREEITDGNHNSREFMTWMTVRPTVQMGYDMARVDDLEKEMRKRAGEITSALLEVSRDESKQTREWAFKFLNQFCYGNGVVPAGRVDPAGIEGLIPRLQEELSSQDASTILAVSLTLIKSAPDSPGLVDALVRVLSDEDAKNRYRAIDSLGQLGSQAASAVPKLVESLEEYCKPSPPGAKSRHYMVNNWGPGSAPDLREEIVKTLGKIGPRAVTAVPTLVRVLEEFLKPTAPLVARSSSYADQWEAGQQAKLCQEIIQTLGEIGPGAKAALPLLEGKVLGHSEHLEPYAEKAIADIKAKAQAGEP